MQLTVLYSEIHDEDSPKIEIFWSEASLHARLKEIMQRRCRKLRAMPRGMFKNLNAVRELEALLRVDIDLAWNSFYNQRPRLAHEDDMFIFARFPGAHMKPLQDLEGCLAGFMACCAMHGSYVDDEQKEWICNHLAGESRPPAVIWKELYGKEHKNLHSVPERRARRAKLVRTRKKAAR